MTTWDDRVRNHAALGRLSSIEATVKAQLDADGLDADAEPWLSRLQRVLSVVHGRLDAADPMLASDAALQQLDTALQAVETQLQNFVSNGNVQHLAQADPQVDAVVQHSMALLAAVPWDEREVGELREHVAAYRQSAGQLISGLRKSAEDLGTKLEGVKSHASEVESERDAKLSELTSAVQEHRASMEQAMTEFRETFSTNQDERRTEFTELVESQKQHRKELLGELKEEAAKQQASTRAEAETLIEEMEGLRDQAATLVDAVGTLGTAVGYGKYAASQKKDADRLRYAAVGVVAVAVVFAVWVLNTAATDVTWQRSVAKLTVVALLGALAAYLGRQSAVHREREAAAKKVELELAALDPYLALMDVADRNEVKKEIARRLFGQPLTSSNGTRGEEPTPTAQTTAVIEALVKALSQQAQ